MKLVLSIVLLCSASGASFGVTNTHPDPHGPGHTHITTGHVDMSFCLQDGVWQTNIVWGPPNSPPGQGQTLRADEAVILLSDQKFDTGNRERRPSEPEWGFIGVGPGEPFWWIPQTSWSGAWVGFNACSGGACASYFEPDPRANATAEWKTLALRRVRYLGKGNGVFSLWSQGPLGELTVWMTTVDGVNAGDLYYVGNGGHAHPSFGFSALGLYELTFTATCYEGPGKTNPHTSPPISFYYAVGSYAEWISRHFAPTNWWGAGQTGEMDDPDGDGISNVMEYALGLHPGQAGAKSLDGAGSMGEPTISQQGAQVRYTLPRRDPSTNPQVEVTVESAANLAGPWLPQTTTTTSGVPHEGWYTDACVLPATPGTRHFFRTTARLLPALAYPE
jgi:surface-anchored protein